MAEVIGLTAGIIAIGGAADTAYKVQRKIRRLARDLGAAQENILKFATEIKDFSLVVSTANLSLHEYSKKSSTENKVFQHIQHHEVLNRIVKASDCVMDHIYKLMPRLKSLESSIPLVERWKWVLRRTEVEALGPKMESVKSGLNLIISVVTLESVLNQGESRENKRLVKRLNRQIVHQKARIAEVEEKLRQAHEQEPESHDEEFFDLQNGVQEIVDLGEIMVDHGSVPDPEEYFGSSSRASVIGFPSTLDVHHPSPTNSQSSRSSEVRSWPERSEPSTSPASPIPSPATTVGTQEIRVRPLELRQERRRIPSRQEQEASSPIGEIVVPSRNPSGQSSPVQQEIAVPRSRDEEDFISVRSKSYLLELNSEFGQQAKPIPGYIHTDTSKIFVTALLDAALDYNVISLAQVRSWGIELEPPDDEDHVWFQFENGEKWKSFGVVVITWSEGAAHLKPLRVRCLVYEHNIRDLIFGKPFLEKREYYRRRDGVEVKESKVRGKTKEL